MKDVVLALFDRTGNMVRPWVEAGYTAVLGEPDARILGYSPGPDRKTLRSATPMGFARAVFEANAQPIFAEVQ